MKSRSISLRAFGFVIFLAGCGEGPKHLQRSDYQHGKAAFEMLEKWEATSNPYYAKEAAKQMLTMPAGSAAEFSLNNYSYAIVVGSDVGSDADEFAPIMKLCRDEAAQYFQPAAATGSCLAELDDFRAKHKN